MLARRVGKDGGGREQALPQSPAKPPPAPGGLVTSSRAQALRTELYLPDCPLCWTPRSHPEQWF